MSEQSTQDQRYNGWANYPTWNVNLWMANDFGLYEQARSMASTALENNTDSEWDEATDEERETVDRDSAVRELADAYEEWVGDMATLDEATFRSDILGWALGHVDW